MMYAHLSVALLAPLLLAIGGTIAPTESLVFKCSNAIQKTPVFFLDGQVVTEAEFKGFDQSGIRSVLVTCISPVDSSILAPGSTVAGLGAIVVWTKLGPVSRLEPALSALAKAQQAHFTRTGAYSGDLASLKLPALPAEVKVSLDATKAGFSASAWVDRRFTPRCQVFDGEVNSPLAGFRSATAGAIACTDN